MVFSFTLVFRYPAQYFLDLSHIRAENSEHGKDADRDKNNGSNNNYGENGDISSKLAHFKTSVYPSTHLVDVKKRK